MGTDYRKDNQMTTRQIEICTRRLAEKTPASAELFIRMMNESRELHLKASAIRRAAWAMYRDITGLPKRDAAKDGR